MVTTGVTDFHKNNELIKQMIIDWSPLLLLSLIYSTLKKIVETIGTVNVAGVYYMEKVLFGWMSNGYGIPAFAFSDVYNPILVIFSVFFYSLHFFVPVLIGIYIGYIRPDRDTFSKLRNSIILVTAMGFTTFILYPVAPPWYVAIYGLAEPINFTGTTETAAGLLKFDQILNISLYGKIYDTTPPAPFAAFPSLHASYSFLTAYVLVKAYGEKNKRIYLMYLYPLSVWFATVFLQHHYIVDLIGGLIYSLTAYYLATKVVQPLYHKYFGNQIEEENISSFEN